MNRGYWVAAIIAAWLSGSAIAQDGVASRTCDMADIADLRPDRAPTGIPCVMTPPIAVMMAAATAPGAIGGTILMTVRASATTGGVLYLNSEADYRDVRNVSVAVPAGVTKQLAARWGSAPGRFLQDRRIRVRGYAQRVRIAFLANGRATGKYYYQTHVVLQSPQQIDLPEPD